MHLQQAHSKKTGDWCEMVNSNAMRDNSVCGPTSSNFLHRVGAFARHLVKPEEIQFENSRLTLVVYDGVHDPD